MYVPTDESYQRWKTLVPFIYDWFNNFNVPWPSLAVRWGSILEDKQYKFSQRVYITEQTGAHPGADSNTILSYNVDVTKPRVAAAEHMLFDDGTDGGFSGGNGVNGGGAVGGIGGENTGGPRVSNINLGFFKKVHAIIHPGEVNNMRSFGSLNPDVLVTHTDSENLYVWDVKRQPGRSFKECRVRNDDPNYRASTPDLILTGHTEFAEFALDCHTKEYKVASGGRDKNVLVWHLPDFGANAAVSISNNSNGKVTTNENDVKGPMLNAQCTFKGHTDTVEDVAFHPTDANILCSVSDDTRLLFWDARCDHGKPVNAVKASEVDVHVVDWNALNTNLIVTGGKDKIVKVWDWRKIGELSSAKKGGRKQGENASEKDMVIMSHSHEGEILRASWSPHDENVFASASDDGCLNVWDLTRKKATTNSDEETTTTVNDNENENKPNDGAADGGNNSSEGDGGNTNKPKKPRYGQVPPEELLFTHSGHRNPITDFQWNPHDPWTVVSSGSGANVASTCQFWRISDLITRSKDDVMQELEKHSAYICGRAAKPADSGDDTDDTGDDTSDGGDDVNTKEEDVVKEEQNMTRNPSYETAQEEPFDAMDS